MAVTREGGSEAPSSLPLPIPALFHRTRRLGRGEAVKKPPKTRQAEDCPVALLPRGSVACQAALLPRASVACPAALPPLPPSPANPVLGGKIWPIYFQTFTLMDLQKLIPFLPTSCLFCHPFVLAPKFNIRLASGSSKTRRG